MRLAGGVPQRFTRRTGFRLALSAFAVPCVKAGRTAPHQPPHLTSRIPPRSPNALTGSQFVESILALDRESRERAIEDQLQRGNLPEFLRNLAPVILRAGTVAATVFAMPEYVAIGSDADYLRIPMNLHTALSVAKRFDFVLPTRRIVDEIYIQSDCRFTPQPLPPGPEMTTVPYFRRHNDLIEKQARNLHVSHGPLVAGHKKDVVLTNRLLTNPDRIAIYGWHWAPRMPIQPLSTVHGATYADYSHGIRLISRTAVVDGELRDIAELLRHPTLSAALSDEGAIRMETILANAAANG